MQTVYSLRHHRHHARAELIDGTMQPPHERPERAELVLRAVEAAALGPVVPPTEHGLEPLAAVHDERFPTHAVKYCLDEAGITAPPAREPLPDIEQHEVRLVAWMAVRGTRGISG